MIYRKSDAIHFPLPIICTLMLLFHSLGESGSIPFRLILATLSSAIVRFKQVILSKDIFCFICNILKYHKHSSCLTNAMATDNCGKHMNSHSFSKLSRIEDRHLKLWGLSTNFYAFSKDIFCVSRIRFSFSFQL